MRQSVPRIDIDGTRWGPAEAWWGRTTAGDAEIDVVANDPDNSRRILVGEVKLAIGDRDVARLQHQLEVKVRSCEWARGKELVVKLWSLKPARPPVLDARAVLAQWRDALEDHPRPKRRPSVRRPRRQSAMRTVLRSIR